MARRLLGLDLGIASAHTAVVLAEDAAVICRRRAIPTVDSLTVLERDALAGAPPDTCLEVVIEPTGPAWLPVAVFFGGRGHTVYRVSSQKAADLRRFLHRHAKTNSIDADTLARLPLVDPDGLHPVELPSAARAGLDRRVRACDRLTQTIATHKKRIRDLAAQLMPTIQTALGRDLGRADLAVLERYGDPHAMIAAGRTRLARLITRASNGHLDAGAPTATWPAPPPPWRCTPTTPRSPTAISPTSWPARSGCCAPPRPNWIATPPPAKPTTSRSTPNSWPAACPALPPSVVPWSSPRSAGQGDSLPAPRSAPTPG
jgi:hypothetical protein